MATRLGVEGPGFESWQGQGVFLFTETSTPALEPASLLSDRSLTSLPGR